jgi:hypothetical protein
MRRCTGGNERRRLELVVRAEEGVRKLRREGMGCSEGQGVSSPFYRGRGAPERCGWGGSNGSVNGFNATEGGVEIKKGIEGGK